MSVKSWIIKYKLYHIPFWFTYHIIWWTINIGSISTVFDHIFHSAYSTKFLFYVIFQAIGAYLNLYFFIPRFLYRGQYLLYLGLVLGTIALTGIGVTSGYYVSAYLSDLSFEQLYNRSPQDYWEIYCVNALSSTAASMTLAMSIKLAKNWIQADQKQRMLEKEKLETELKFLKSQFNPHFLFNTINSIFVLIHKNPDLASDSLATFSDLLRYQLYECNEQDIDLDKEIGFMEDFIQLEKLRVDEKQTQIQFEVDKNGTQSLQIAPFILMPFVENAFKHVSKGKNQPNYIRIALSVEDQVLQFEIENSSSGQKNTVLNEHAYQGIGLKNVRRRLELLYPENYQLDITNEERRYCVQLSIALQNSRTSNPVLI